MLEAIQLFIYFVVIFGGIYAVSVTKYKASPLGNYFLIGFLLKVIGGLFFGVIYVFYYGGGDTLNYFRDCDIIFEAFVNSPIDAFRIIFSPEIKYDFGLHQYTTRLWYDRDPASFMVVRICSLVNIVGLNSFWSTTLLMSTVSFLAVWKLYLSLVRLYPVLYKQFAVAVLFMPSVFFWGSGIMKDTITLTFLAWLLAMLIEFKLEKVLIRQWIVIPICFSLILITKAYVAACLVPAILLYIVVSFKSKINNALVRSLITPLILLVTIFGSIWMLNAAEDYLGKFALSKFDETVETYVWWHSKVVQEIQHGKGSHYSLGQIGGKGLIGLLFKFPLAVNVTLFRPYLWEVKNPIMLLTALESFFVLFLTIKVLRLTGISFFINKILTNGYVAFLMVYSLLFCFAVGLASNNFGALARYKIPGLIMYMIAVFFIQHLYDLKNQENNLK